LPDPSVEVKVTVFDPTGYGEEGDRVTEGVPPHVSVEEGLGGLIATEHCPGSALYVGAKTLLHPEGNVGGVTSRAV